MPVVIQRSGDPCTPGRAYTRKPSTAESADKMPSSGKKSWKLGCISDGSFHFIARVRGLSPNAGSVLGVARPDLGIYDSAHALFATMRAASSLVEMLSLRNVLAMRLVARRRRRVFQDEKRFGWSLLPTARGKRIAPLRKRDGSLALCFLPSNDKIHHQPTDILPLMNL